VKLTISGMRLEWTVHEIRSSIAVMKPPLTKQELAGGWSEEVRTLMIASYEKITGELGRRYIDQRQYKSWIRGLDGISKEALRSRDGSTTGDDAILFLSDAQIAVNCLMGAIDLMVHCEAPEDFVGELRRVTELLERGGYLNTRNTLTITTLVSQLITPQRALDGSIREVIRDINDSILHVLRDDASRERIMRSR